MRCLGSYEAKVGSQRLWRRPRPKPGRLMTAHVRDSEQVRSFRFVEPGPTGSAAAYLHDPVLKSVGPLRPTDRVLDVGCGNGHWAGVFAALVGDVVGVDPSPSGVELARQSVPNGRFEQMPAVPDLRERLGESPFDIVLSLEVVEHVYSPRSWATACFMALKPGGLLVCSTPYHGYLKKLSISVVGGWDRHWQPLNEGGHIKFWSPRTLTRLLSGAGFEVVRVRGAGRPWLWKSMVISARRPVDTSR